MTIPVMKVWVDVIVCYDHARTMDDHNIARGAFRACGWENCQVPGCKNQAALAAQVLVDLK